MANSPRSHELKWLVITFKLAALCASPPLLTGSAKKPSAQPRRTASKLEAQILNLRRQRRSYAQIMMVLPVSKATSTIKKLGRFTRPGVRATGDSHRAQSRRRHREPSRPSTITPASLHPNEKTPAVLAALHPAVKFYNAHGGRVATAYSPWSNARRVTCCERRQPSRQQPLAGA
jgi:hypothetical protein